MITDRLLSNLVSRMVPQFVIDEYPQFVTFLKQVFRYMEQEKQAYDIIANLLSYVDVDETLDEFEVLFKEQFARSFPAALTERDSVTGQRKLDLVVKNIRSFYKNKGTEDSYAFLFSTLYSSNTAIAYPKVNILSLSDGWWYVPNYLVLEDELGNIPPQKSGGGYYHLPLLVGKYLTGVRTGATANVISAKEIPFPVDGWVSGDYLENKFVIEVDEEEGSFLPGEMVSYSTNYIQNGNFAIGTINWVLRKEIGSVLATVTSDDFYTSGGSMFIKQDASTLHDNYMYQELEIDADSEFVFRFTITGWDGTLGSGDFNVKIGYAPNTSDIYDSVASGDIPTGSFNSEVDVTASVQTIKVNTPFYITVYANRGLGEYISFDGLGLYTDTRLNVPVMVINKSRGIDTATVNNGGTGYLLNDILTIDNGTDEPARLKVTELYQEVATANVNLLGASATIYDTFDYITIPDVVRWSDNALVNKTLSISGSTSDDGTYTILENIGTKVTVNHTFAASEDVTVAVYANSTGSGYAVNDVINVRGGTPVGGDIAQLRVATLSTIIDGMTSIQTAGLNYVVGDILTISGGTGDAAQLKVSSVGSSAKDPVTINSGGYGYTASDVLTVSGGSGTQPQITVSTVVSTLDANQKPIIHNPGTGYAVDDVVYYGSFRLNVESVNGAGGITSVSILDVGSFPLASKPANPVTMSTESGVGAGATIEVFWLDGVISTATVSTAGLLTSKNTSPMTVTGGTGGGATVTLSWDDGKVLDVDIYAPGNYSISPSNPVSVTGGTGTGATFNPSYDSGAIATVTIENAGTYETPPTNPVFVYGGGGGFFVTWQDGDSIKNVSVEHPGLFYTEVASPASVTGGAGTSATFDLTYTDNGIILDEGTWIDERGWISEPSMKIRDNYYYQEYSYVITSAVSVDTYRSVVKDNIHPAGLVMFSVVQEDEDDWLITNNSTMHTIDTGFIINLTMNSESTGSMNYPGWQYSDIYINPSDSWGDITESVSIFGWLDNVADSFSIVLTDALDELFVNFPATKDDTLTVSIDDVDVVELTSFSDRPDTTSINITDAVSAMSGTATTSETVTTSLTESSAVVIT